MITQKYSDFSKNLVFIQNNPRKPKANNNLENILAEQSELLKMKIQQDIIFYLTLSLDYDENLFSEFSIDYGDTNFSENFLKENKITEEIEKTLVKYNDILTEKSSEFIITQKEIRTIIEENEKISKELADINNFFFKYKGTKPEIKDLQEKDLSIIIDNKDNYNNVNNNSSDEVITQKINEKFISDKIKENIKAFIPFIILRLFYKTFEEFKKRNLSDLFLLRLTKEIVENEKKFQDV